MKNIFYTIILNFLLVNFVIAENKIAIVNISNVFQQSSQRTETIKQLENEFKDRVAELQSMEHDLQNKMQFLQNSGVNMQDNERSELEKMVIKQRENFSDKAQAFEQDNRRRQTEERDKIMNNIQNVITKIAIAKNYDLVIDANAIAYFNNIKDITEEVLNKLNK